MKRIFFIVTAFLLLFTGCNLIGGRGNEPPVAYIDSISPSSPATGGTVNFTGHGTDANGSVVGYRWRSSIDGDLSAMASFDSSSLSAGEHTIFFKVQDNNGAWSDEVETSVTVGDVSASASAGGSAPGASPGPSAGLPYINSFTADPGMISPGGSATLSWDVSNADSVTVGYGTSINTVSPVNSATVSPPGTTTYTLTATGGGTTVSATVEIIVSGAGAPAPASGLPVINLTANPSSVLPGGVATLSYNVANASTVTLSSSTGTKVSTLLQHSGSLSVQPTATTTYTITATNAIGSATASTTVSVGPAIFVPGVILATQTREFSLVTSESGSINSDHVVSLKMIAGDATTKKASWAYFSFNISAIAGKEVTKAELIYSPSALNGKPWPDLVSLGIYQVNHGARPLKPSDFTFIGPTIAEGLSQIQTIVPVDVTSQVQNSVTSGKPRFQVRLNFVKMTDNDGQADNISWTSTTPKLRVTYR